MPLYYLFWMIMGFIIHFYITFGTNLLTRGPANIVVLLHVSVFRRKVISNGVQTEWNLRERDFWNERDPGDMELKPGKLRGGHEAGGAPTPSGRTLHARGPLVAPLSDFFRLCISIYPKNIREIWLRGCLRETIFILRLPRIDKP